MKSCDAIFIFEIMWNVEKWSCWSVSHLLLMCRALGRKCRRSWLRCCQSFRIFPDALRLAGDKFQDILRLLPSEVSWDRLQHTRDRKWMNGFSLSTYWFSLCIGQIFYYSHGGSMENACFNYYLYLTFIIIIIRNIGLVGGGPLVD